MSTMITVHIQLFGAFRRVCTGPVAVHVAADSDIAAVKHALAIELRRINNTFDDQLLIEQSVLATERAVLDHTACVQHDMQLAILPPVCGG